MEDTLYGRTKTHQTWQSAEWKRGDPIGYMRGEDEIPAFTDPEYKGASSINLLKQVRAKIEQKGFRVASVSAVVHAERPRIAEYVAQIRGNLAAAMGVNADSVNVSATTWEGLSFVGRKEGIAASASCLIT